MRSPSCALLDLESSGTDEGTSGVCAVRLETPDPTAFDWWAGVVLPSVVGLLSLLLAGVSLWIALRAQKTSNDALEVALRESDMALRASRGGFAAKVRELESLTSKIRLPISEGEYQAVYDLHQRLHAEALAVGQPGAEDLVWYAAMVHWTPNRQREMSGKSPRDRPSPASDRSFPIPVRWQTYAKLEGRWIEDPTEPVEAIREQERALTGDSEVVFNIKQWTWPWS